jgi:hypothetical protein
MVPYQPKKRLMLVDNPRLLFKTLQIFKEFEKNIGKEVHIKTAHTYFYTSSIYKIIIKSNKNLPKPAYRLSSIGVYIIDIYNDENKKIEYSNTLKNLLLNNKIKGELFRDFLMYVEKPKKIKEIYEKYLEPTGKTLIAWCLEANLIRRKKYIVGLIKNDINSNISIDKFWTVLKDIYTDMQMTDFLLIKKIYVDLDEVKLRVTCELGISDGLFDEFLQKLMASEYSKFITLDGGPSSVYKDQYTFKYKGKNYLYLSMRIK